MQALTPTGNKAKPPGVPSHTSQTIDNTQQFRGLSRATSIITNHVMEISSSLTPINEEDDKQDTTTHKDPEKNPFIFQSNGVIHDDGSPPITMVISSADKSTTNDTISTESDITVTNTEDDDEEIKNDISTSGKQTSQTQVNNRINSYHIKVNFIKITIIHCRFQMEK